MGVAAMSLAGGEYAIHGTNQPGSIGHFVSYGCIRMYNEDITDLIWSRQRRHAGGGPVIGEVSGTPDTLTGDGVGHQELTKSLMPDTWDLLLTISTSFRAGRHRSCAPSHR